MNTPIWLCIDDEWTVPISSTLFHFGPQEIKIHVAGFKQALKVPNQSEVAEALRAWKQGTQEFPVNSNGVIDLGAGWEAAQTSRYKMANIGANEGEVFGLREEARQELGLKPFPAEEPAAPPRIDWRRVEERAK